MFPNYPGSHGAYQDFVVRRLREHYTDPTQLPSGLLDIAERFRQKYLTGVNTIAGGILTLRAAAKAGLLYAAFIFAVH